MNEIFEKIYNDNNTDLNESSALFEKVYTEAEMLNEMNPKLRALLAAGLIGTAGLGATSCSMPTDDPYDAQYTIEQPTPENPEEIEEIEDSEDSEEITDSEDSENFEDPENPENPEDSEYTVTFKTLGVAVYAESLAGAIKDDEQKSFIKDISDYTDLIYKDGFVPVEFDDDHHTYEDGQTYIRYIDLSDKVIFYIPIDMESDFDAAIAAYKAAHAE